MAQQKKINTLVIIISGKRCSGKTTLAEKIYNIFKNNTSISIMPIANSLKQSFCKFYNIDYDSMINNYDIKQQNRKLLLKFAKNKQKIYGNEYWIHDLLQSIPQHIKIIIIPDVRRIYEIYEIKKQYVTIAIRVEVPQWVRKKRGYIYDKYIDLNIFETDLDNYKWDIIYDTHEYH